MNLPFRRSVALRRSIVLLAATQLVACSRWQARLEGPRAALDDPDVRHVRLTLTDRQRLEVRVAEIRGDSIYGTVGGSGPVTCMEAGPLCTAAIPLSQVGFLEARAFSAVRTIAVVAVPVGIVLLAAGAGSSCDSAVNPGC